MSLGKDSGYTSGSENVQHRSPAEISNGPIANSTGPGGFDFPVTARIEGFSRGASELNA